ncbi:NPCBM/NEW2 domain-containing protein [Phyllobacterium sp. LjRoot231]
MEKDRSNGEEKANDGPPSSVRNVAFAKGLGVSAPTQIFYRPAGKCSQLTVAVGVDDYYFTKPESERKGKGNVAFEIWGDGNLLAESGVMTPYSPKKTLTANLADVSTLRLIVKPSDDKDAYDYPDWAEPKITCQ